MKDKKKENTANPESIVFMFPGQGSQYTDMGKEFLDANDKYSKYFEISSKVIGRDLMKIISGESGRDSLDNTRFSQISIYSLSCALNDYIAGDLSINKKLISTVLGHSLGEYSALYSSGAYSFRQGAELVWYRGKIMSEANQKTKGMMAAVLGTEISVIEDVLTGFKDRVFIANYNDYSQTVISGYKQAVREAISDLMKHGAKKAIPLKVNIASHCPLMREVSNRLGEFVGKNIKFEGMKLPFFSTTEVAYKNKHDMVKTLTGQLTNSIRWVESIEYLLSRNISIFVEIGPGKVLSGLVGRIARERGRKVVVLNTSKMEDINDLKSSLVREGFINEA